MTKSHTLCSLFALLKSRWKEEKGSGTKKRRTRMVSLVFHAHWWRKRRKNWSEILFYKKEIVEEKGKYNNHLYMTGHSHTGITDVKLKLLIIRESVWNYELLCKVFIWFVPVQILGLKCITHLSLSPVATLSHLRN